MTVSNEDIYEKLGKTYAGVKSNGKRLDALNSQVEKNTSFRLKHLGAYKVLAVIGSLVIGAVAYAKEWFHGG